MKGVSLIQNCFAFLQSVSLLIAFDVSREDVELWIEDNCKGDLRKIYLDGKTPSDVYDVAYKSVAVARDTATDLKNKNLERRLNNA